MERMLSGTIVSFTESPNDFITLTFYHRYCRCITCLLLHKAVKLMYNLLLLLIFFITPLSVYQTLVPQNSKCCHWSVFSYIHGYVSPPSSSVEAAQAFSFCPYRKESGEIKRFVFLRKSGEGLFTRVCSDRTRGIV